MVRKGIELMTDRVTLEVLESNLGVFHKMYDMVRLVDPIDKKVVEFHGLERNEINEICYNYWKDKKICDNCISVRAYLEEKCYFKLEETSDTIMMVTAIMIENSKKPTVIELFKNASDSMMIGSGDYSDGRMLSSVLSELRDMVIRDKLSGLYNRRYVEDRLPADIVKAALEKLPLSIIFIDIDNFKDINDTYGHAYGDKALIDFAISISQCIRPDSDWAARYGGDEFLICLTNTTEIEAYQIADEIRCKIPDLSISENEKVKISASLGVYTMEDSTLTAEELISFADKKMYKEKQQRKNCNIEKENT